MNIYEGYIRVEKRSYCREHEENISNEALQKKIFPHEHQKTVEMIKINRWSQTSLALLSQFFSYTVKSPFTLNHFKESQNHRPSWVGSNLEAHLVPILAMARATFHETGLLKATSNLPHLL